MSRLIDADALERDGWQMSRTVRVNKDVMELQTRKPTDFPAVEPRTGKWVEIEDHIFAPIVVCSNCSQTAIVDVYGKYQRTRYCPNCGADMRETE